MKKHKIGVFICHCGMNIAGGIDVEKLRDEIAKYPGVAHAENYIYMCSDPGQAIVRKAIQEKGLTGLVMSNCSPSLHQTTYRNLAVSEGLNPYHCEIANIREWVSWPHPGKKEIATKKAYSVIRSVVERLKLNMALYPQEIPLTRKVVIIGGGIAGMQAALDIANAGYKVYLVERSPNLGGHVVQLGGLVVTMDDALCSINSMMMQVMEHPNIEKHIYHEISVVEGFVGSFDITLKKKARFVDWDRCDGCRKCTEVCPVSVTSEFDCGIGTRPAIYTAYTGSIPGKPVIDEAVCLSLKGEVCDKCKEACPLGAINFQDKPEDVKFRTGACIVATGFDLYEKENLSEFDADPDIIDSMQFERLISPTGPTGGDIRRPSDGSLAKSVAFIKCSGSRDPEHHFPYCSRICCMYTGKQARLFKRQVPDGNAFIFYMDIRSTGKGHEEFIEEAVKEEKLIYLRGRVSRIWRNGKKLVVRGVDTLSGKMVELNVDMVVLAMAATGVRGIKETGRILNIIIDQYGFASEAHIKLGPLDTLTSGIYLCGSAQYPKDIPDTITQASGAAAKILSLFSREKLLSNPEIAHVDIEVCAGCGYCEKICAYQAPKVNPKTRIAEVNEAVCEGCGACAALCPSGAMQLKNFNNKQVFNMINIMTKDYEYEEEQAGVS